MANNGCAGEHGRHHPPSPKSRSTTSAPRRGRSRHAIERTPTHHSRTLSQHRGLRHLAEIREPAVHRFVQGARRAEQADVADAGRAQARRGRDERRQSCARRRVSCGAPRHSRHHRDAGRHALQKMKHTKAFGATRHAGRRDAERKLHARQAKSPRATISSSCIPMTTRRSSRGRAPSRSNCWKTRRMWTRWSFPSAAAD